MAPPGRFFPSNPKKYAGDSSNIIYRSSWERTFMEYCDRNPDVVTWASEELHIPYFFIGDGKWHRYFPDFLMTTVQARTNRKQTWVVEVKPYKQTLAPVAGRTRGGRRYLREVVAYQQNQAKWTAAQAFCQRKGWRFVVITEKDLYPRPK